MKCYVCGDVVPNSISVCKGCGQSEYDETMIHQYEEDSTRLKDPEVYQTSPGEQ